MLTISQIHDLPSPPPPPPWELFLGNTDSILLSLHDDPDVYGCTGAFTAGEKEVRTACSYTQTRVN